MSDKKSVVDYYARTSLRSIVSEPVSINDDHINLSSDFQKNMVKRDFSKTFFSDVTEKEFDYLMIDLVDERFDLIRIGHSLVTRSNEYVNAGLESVFQGEKLIKSTDGWEKDCITFSQRLLSILPVKKIVIHEAYWANKYIDDGAVKEYPNQKNIDANNEILKQYYAILKKAIPAKVVRTQNELIGDSKHAWGVTPFHYTDDYYKEIYNQIRA